MAKETINGIPNQMKGLKELLNTKFELVDKMAVKFREIQKLKGERLTISHDLLAIANEVKMNKIQMRALLTGILKIGDFS